MGIQLKRVDNGEDKTNPTLWTILTSGPLARRWIGKAAPQVSQLALQSGKNTLLYFRTRGCVICDLIDMRVAAACRNSGVDLIVIDRYSKSDAPEDKEIYNQPGNILDFGGLINSAFQIGIYPSLVLINEAGQIVLKQVGSGKTPPEQFGEYLQDRFSIVLAI
ncbi:hypothetical protein [Deinococcus sp.]|uniref:hypothetical protein n=1 Tax=Deinococcus sp. TaxID=47478 RepID=UPI003C7B0D5D